MKKILVVEDEDIIRKMVIDILTRNGYKPVGAENGKAGIDMAFSEMPDMIICDVMMPGADGYEVLKKLQKNKSTASIPFIFITAKADRLEVRKGMESGADDYITKPFTDDELVRAIKIQFRKAAYKYSAQKKKHERVESLQSRKRLSETGHIFLDVNKEPQLMKISSLIYITSLGDYSKIFTENGRIIVRRSMKNWERILPDSTFIRIHRSTIINMDYIEKIEKWFNRAYKLYLKGTHEPFIISRRYITRLRHLIF